MRNRKLFLALLALLPVFLAACSSLGLEKDASYDDPNREKLYKNGSLLGDDGGTIVGGSDKQKEGESGLGVNGFLWRASLDTIAFMPIASADPFGGVIITDWYSPPDTPGERVKLNVFILDRDLRADGVKVTVFRQVKQADGNWMDTSVTPTTGGSLEETILTRARQLRLAQKEFK